ncbi:MAG: hypothetical protein JO067_06530 [Cupriavidus sp.]|nr:hypothetical protein [Cupriavidus sp.]
MNRTDEIAMGVSINMRTKATEQELAAARSGVALDVVVHVHKNDGSKNYATTLAEFLCANPEHADGTRDDMAGIITRELGVAKPFPPSRVSKDLTAKSRHLVEKILKHHGYPVTTLITALDIRDIVKAGKSVVGSIQHSTETVFHVDGLTLNGKRYDYILVDETTVAPWYRFGILCAGRRLQLTAVLAMRSIGIGQFQNMDELAHRVASPEQLAKRDALMG